MNRRSFLRLGTKLVLAAAVTPLVLPKADQLLLPERRKLFRGYSIGELRQHKLWGDGWHDDTAAIQELLDHGGYVLLPPGDYLITSTLVMDVDGTIFDGGGHSKIVYQRGEPCALYLPGTEKRRGVSNHFFYQLPSRNADYLELSG